MKTVVLSASSVRALAALSRHGVLAGAARRADGRFDVELEDDIALQLERIDADPDQAIAKVATRQWGRA